MATKPKDVKIVRDGTEIILPEKMSLTEGAKWLIAKAEAEEKTTVVETFIECVPYDGLVAAVNAMKERYGFIVASDNPWGCPVIEVQLAEGKTITCPVGAVEIPGIFGSINLKLMRRGLYLSYETKKKHEPEVKALFDLIRAELAKNSIYKGHALRVDFSNDLVIPEFMSLDPALESQLSLPEATRNAVESALFTPIEHSEACRRHGVPLKRGVLLYGLFGTGKTLTASVAGIKAVRHGWTYIYATDAKSLADAMEFAKRYAPAVVFIEDIDRATSGDRTAKLGELLNTIDGVDYKNAEIITVFTSNDVDAINPAMMRMGRLDAVIEVSPPDAGAAAKLLRHYARGTLATDADDTVIGKRLAGKIPAFIREVAERSKLTAIGRMNGGDITGNVLHDDIVRTADILEAHDKRIWAKKAEPVKNARVLVEVPSDHVAGKVVIDSLQANGTVKQAEYEEMRDGANRLLS